MRTFVGKLDQDEDSVRVSYALPQKDAFSKGHSWGYDGAGPRSLAYDILFELFGDLIARRYAEAFMEDVIEKQRGAGGRPNDGFRVTEREVRHWLDDHIDRHTTDSRVAASRDPERADEYRKASTEERQQKIDAWSRKIAEAHARVNMDGWSTDVKTRGEPMTLRKAVEYYGDDFGIIVARFGDWVVTDNGLNCLYVQYPISAKDLWDGPSAGATWFDQLSGKTWMRDWANFGSALEAARRFHKDSPFLARRPKDV
jgi:hypothetical protein